MDCDSQRGKNSDRSGSRKPYSYVLTCSVDSFGFFPFFSSSVVVVTFIGTMKFNYAFEAFFFFSSLSHTFYYCKPLPLGWAFAVLGSFLFSFLSF